MTTEPNQTPTFRGFLRCRWSGAEYIILDTGRHLRGILVVATSEDVRFHLALVRRRLISAENIAASTARGLENPAQQKTKMHLADITINNAQYTGTRISFHQFYSPQVYKYNIGTISQAMHYCTGGQSTLVKYFKQSQCCMTLFTLCVES